MKTIILCPCAKEKYASNTTIQSWKIERLSEHDTSKTAKLKNKGDLALEMVGFEQNVACHFPTSNGKIAGSQNPQAISVLLAKTKK
jgi:hypothetical protein